MTKLFVIRKYLFLSLLAFSNVCLATATPSTKPLPNALPSLPSTGSAPIVSTATTATPQPPAIAPAPPVLDANGYILVDANSGAILAQKNATQKMYPASLTKLMSMYVISGAIRSGQIHLTDMVPIGVDAWRTGGSRMFVKVGTQVPVQQLLDGIIIASGNDATVAMADYVGGNQASFVNLMNKTAAALGMKDTHFVDATGLPDPNHYTTPFDLAILTRHIIHDYPEDYKLYSQKWITYNNIRQPNRNRLLWHDPSADGLKTGHTDEAGYCLIGSAQRNGMRLIAVVMGAPSDSSRTNDAQALLNYGFRFFETHKLFAAQSHLTEARVWLGQAKYTPMGLTNDLYITIPKGQYGKLKANLTLDPSLKAPIVQGHTYGNVTVTLNGQVITTQPLIALESNPLGSFWSRLSDHIHLFFSRWFSKA